jgi:hypothetical protein
VAASVVWCSTAWSSWTSSPAAVLLQAGRDIPGGNCQRRWWRSKKVGAVGCIDHERGQLPHHAPYFVVLQNGFNVWDNRWRHMDHLQCLFLTNFGYMAHPMETI